MIWFTADTHFGHANVLKYENRPFMDCQEMDEYLIAQWNQYVEPGDTIYHLGDFAFCGVDRMREIFSQLNGNKHLILGNHDDNRTRKLGWGSIDWYREIKYAGTKVCLFHFPIENWNGKHHGFYHFHGHCHSNQVDSCNGLRLNVGVDVSGFSPISIEGLLDG
jgi:calcineurin-like phosphoesterase family protein